jgi:uncharacterized membrane protein (UPF0136 family)
MKKSNAFHYLVLFILLSAGIIGYFSVRGNNTQQLMVGVITSISYMIWGFIHHRINRDLHLKVVIEYILIGCIAMILLATVLR